MKFFKIIRDYKWGYDGCVVTLSDGANDIISGCYFSDSIIEEKINAFFQCLDYLGVAYSVEYIRINEDE